MTATRLLKQLVDSNEFPWMVALEPWAPRAQKELRQLRRIARRQLRAQLIARQGWFRTLTQAAAWPFISTLKAFIAILHHPGPRRMKLNQFCAYVWLQWRHNLSIAEQQAQLLTLSHRRTNAAGHIPCREHQALMDLCMARIEGSPYIFEKQEFGQYCARHHLPAAINLAEGTRAEITQHHPWPQNDLFLKPANLGKGQGAEVLRYEANSRIWLGANDERLDPSTILAYTRKQFNDGPWVLQPRLRNAATWQSFTTGGLATTRVVTGRLHRKGPPVVIGAYLRLPRKGAIVDNLCDGGIGAMIELETGRLSKGEDYFDHDREYTTHPDTGAPIEGMILPGFAEICSLAIRAHSLTIGWVSIGWDIGLTESGPQLIEANRNWAIIPGYPITNTRYVGMIRNALQLAPSP
jgi:hypothetical protein